MRYLILQDPGHNKVYYKESKALYCELELGLESIGIKQFEVSLICLGGVDYLQVETQNTLDPSALVLLSRLSFCFAIFIMEKNDDKLSLMPVERHKEDYLPER